MSSARTMDTKLQELEGFGEENSGKKKSKFKSIKKFFGKRKRKETPSASGSSSLKPCQSAGDVTASQTMHIDYDSEDELEIHRNIMGSRALSHDSIFIPEASQESSGPVRVFSQENVSDRIRALQLKLQQNWKSSFPYSFGIPSKRVDDAGMNSEDDGLPRSPPETSLLHEILNSSTAKFSDSHKHLSSLSLAGTGSEEEEQVTSSPSRLFSVESQLMPQQPSAKIVRTSDCSLSPPADFDTPPELSSCLDNSAAKHKLLVKPRNQRSGRTRKPPLRNLSTSQNDLSSTLEQDENEEKEMVAEVTNKGEELIGPASETTYVQLPEVSKVLPHKLTPQDGKVCMLSSTAELDSHLYENNPEDCQMQELPQMVPLLLSSDSKEATVSLCLSPDQEEKEQSGPLKMSSGDRSGMSHSILNQESKQIYDAASKNNVLSDRNQNDMIPSLDETEKNAFKDPKALLEVTCNKGTVKIFPSLTNSVNLSPKNTFHSTYLPYHEDSSISQTSHTVSSSQMDRPSSLTPNTMKRIEEQPESDKETHCTPIPSGLVLGGKEGSEPYGLRKFSVSSARERPRTSSLKMKENLERENSLATQALQMRTKNSSSNENGHLEVNCLQQEKRCSKKQASQLEPELEMDDGATDRAVVASQPQPVGSKPVLSKSSIGLPWQSSVGQSSCEDKNPFQVKLRSTSLSLKHSDGFSQESKEIKRHSAEFSLEKEVPPVSSLKGDRAEVRKTTDVNINNFLNDGLRMKSKSPEQGATKPPLPRKPVLQHFIISGTNTTTEKPEKMNKGPELKHEDKDSEEKESTPELPEKDVPYHGIFVDATRITESQTMPAWITIAKQKQRAIEQELSKEEKPVVQEEKTDAEKQIQEKERMEEAVKQQPDFTWSTFSPFPPTVSSEKQKKETKLDIQDSLPRASILSHHSPVQSLLVPTEKEDIKPLKKSSHSPDQPSWMELAKKKSQAWSDMPQRIK